MPTTFSDAHHVAVRATIELVDTVRIDDLPLPTPCAGWNLLDLLAHMTVQHHGFAAAARASGADLAIWQPDTVRAAVSADPGATYAAAARDVLDAFTADGVAEATFALPEFGPDASAPGATAMGFHFVDYVVHGWDVAATLGVPYDLPSEVVSAVTPLVLAVPDGEFRAAPESPFARALEPDSTDHGLARILRHLGRRPDWRPVNASAVRST